MKSFRSLRKPQNMMLPVHPAEAAVPLPKEPSAQRPLQAAATLSPPTEDA